MTSGARDGHEPVLLDAVLEALDPCERGIYVDATFGRGGHSEAILKQLGPQGQLLALDRDPDAVEHGRARLARDPRVRIEQASFGDLERVAREHGVLGRVDGLLLDLGISSPQLEDASRGFSFLREGPLDMRMDPGGGVTAAQWLEGASEAEIARVLKDYGEERFARRIARAICEARGHRPVRSTGELAELIARAVPRREPNKHPATRSFQAIRIYINQELQALEAGLQQSLHVLAPGGRLVVITFHSLEDRLVKRFIRRQERGPELPRGLPVREAERPSTMRAIGKPVHPDEAEVARNPRARSATLRAAERLP